MTVRIAYDGNRYGFVFQVVSQIDTIEFGEFEFSGKCTFPKPITVRNFLVAPDVKQSVVGPIAIATMRDLLTCVCEIVFVCGKTEHVRYIQGTMYLPKWYHQIERAREREQIRKGRSE